jgi:hypothetical protein
MSRPVIVILVILANVVLAIVAIVLFIAGPGLRFLRQATQPPKPEIVRGNDLFAKKISTLTWLLALSSRFAPAGLPISTTALS